ncbi:glycolipid 2-alpha-mannosyltransferase 1 [Cladorrhinum sp. PSN259]|nr:glycolipid 2-alpha-mannosyltransferase 1 [Cladorrhinum sp. PSN259]
MKLLPALAVAVFRQLRRPARRVRLLVKGAAFLLALWLFDTFLHSQLHSVPRPPEDLDGPFQIGCQDPTVAAASHPRVNAAFVMLARNSEIDEARRTIENIEAQFNRWFNYPVVFLNNEEWSPEFVRVLNKTVSGKAIFDVIPQADWDYPEWMNKEEARMSIKKQEGLGVYNGGKESYHHMCRFYSGAFYNLPALANFKYYWRLEPGVSFSCAITYDPFLAMSTHNKTYGFTTALWELPQTCPSLFRAVDDFRLANSIPSTPSWNSIISPAWDPLPVRLLKGYFNSPQYSSQGDRWNLCHYWSNFEIADLDFFRSNAYQALFKHLDKAGGFYNERWGDAPVHSLAVHLLLPVDKLHHFSDFGYLHAPFWQCPGNAPGKQEKDNDVLGSWEDKRKDLSEESEGAIGCRCKCPNGNIRRNNRGICLGIMQAPQAFHRPSRWEMLRGKWPYTINIPG